MLAILVTGGAGYIGSHTVLSLQKKGYNVIVLDNLVYGHPELIKDIPNVKLIIGDINDATTLEQIFKNNNIQAVIHFAAYAYVGESVTDPNKYYRNNVVGTLTLLETMLKAGITKIVFSSTCATYGIPKILPIPESHPQIPINPYGMSKLMVETILKDFDQAYGLKSVIFRYFNAAGADPHNQLGEDHQPETHLIPLVLLAALGKQDNISIFGTDYPTADGTCIRDYIHVSDLADAHILGLEYLLTYNESNIFNLGNGQGFSIKDVIETAKKVTGKSIPIKFSDRRRGDPAVLVGSSEKAKKILEWNPQYTSLYDMIDHAWKWHQKRHSEKKLYNQNYLF
jgi:UDP-glucose 4-epimerase